MVLSLYANCAAADRAPRGTALTFPDILADPLVRLIIFLRAGRLAVLPAVRVVRRGKFQQGTKS